MNNFDWNIGIEGQVISYETHFRTEKSIECFEIIYSNLIAVSASRVAQQNSSVGSRRRSNQLNMNIRKCSSSPVRNERRDRSSSPVGKTK